MKVAVVSLDSVWEDKKANLEQVKNAVLLCRDKAEYIIFPEMSLTGFSVSNLDLAEDINDSASVRAIQQLARDNQINIVFGLMTIFGDQKYNSCVAVASNGEIAGNYEKMHLFSYSGEDELISGGDVLKSLSWEGGWGMSICFDLRFPEIYQKLSKENLILLNIANWPKRRVAHWRNLLTARAIENQSFMIGVNRTGTDGNGLEYEESSCVFLPDGRQLDPVEAIDKVKIFDLDITEAIKYRQDFPIKKDRQEKIYKEFYN